MYKAAIESVVKSNSVHVDHAFPAHVRPRPSLDNSVIEEWVAKGIVPREFLDSADSCFRSAVTQSA